LYTWSGVGNLLTESTGDDEVVIAIHDTGVDYNHIDLKDNIWYDPITGTPGYDFGDNDNDPMDEFGHGTFCAGITAAVTNNSKGIAGVSWNCKIMPIKVNEGAKDDFTLEAAYNGLIYAIDKGADVISMSWGFPMGIPLLHEVINYAYNQDIVLVAAAGNDDTVAKLYPAAYENVIAVAATDKYDDIVSFSNYGDWVDVAAPGFNILSLRAKDTDMYGDGSHIVYEDYYIANGTSFSCPHVAGLSALLLSKNQCPNPAEMVESIIKISSDELDSEKYVKHGRINAYNALNQESFAAVLNDIKKWEDVKETIDIYGTAWGENFKYYLLEIGNGENPNSWHLLENSSESQTGNLISLHTTGISEGLHAIRLKVVCDYGVYSDKTFIYVNNEADGTYQADIHVSNCYDSSTPEFGIKKFSTIQEGIKHAKSGDTIFTYDGIYFENIKSTFKSIKLIGQSKDWTIVEGNIKISYTSKAEVKGFKIRESDDDFLLKLHHSIKCEITHNILDASIFQDCLMLSSSSNNLISDNIIKPGVFDRGIHLISSDRNTITENTLICIYTGIEIRKLSKKNIINDNLFDNCYTAIKCDTAYNNKITNNTIKNSNYGMIIEFSVGNKIYKNNIEYSEEAAINGLYSLFNKIIGNRLTNNFFGVDLQLWISNNIYYNNFEESTARDAYHLNYPQNVWYKEKIIGKDMGNYWSDYKIKYPHVENKDNDGVWDEPYEILCNFDMEEPAEDKYPVVNPFDLTNLESIIEATVSETNNVDYGDVLSELETIQSFIEPFVYENLIYIVDQYYSDFAGENQDEFQLMEPFPDVQA